ncbi:MAG: YceD family protein [Solirubrobacteraceae bacterium]
MRARADAIDLGALRLSSGGGRRLGLAVSLAPLELGGERYEIERQPLPVSLDVSRTTGEGFALRLRFAAHLTGPCVRCLAVAAPVFEADAREVDQPGEGEELESPYLHDGVLELGAWARDALALIVPAQILCRPDCAGLCPECGADLNLAAPGHAHERPPDARWAKLSQLRPG